MEHSLTNVSVRLSPVELEWLDELREDFRDVTNGRPVSRGEAARLSIISERKRSERRAKR